MDRLHRNLLTLALAGAAVLTPLAGCSRHHDVTAPLPSAAPAPTSPSGAIDLFRWGWEHRDTTAVGTLLTDDFRFMLAAADSTGAAFEEWSLGRDEFMRCVRNLFLGMGPMPPARRIGLSFDPNLLALPDSRPGKTALWHQEIRTSVNLTVDDGTDVWRVTGHARFYVVRGDSAAIPPFLVAHHVRPDSTRWYVERIEDETVGGSTAPAARPSAPLPTKATTWGSVLVLFLRGF